MLVAPEVRKVGWRHLGRGEIKSCTPLWRKADFEVKNAQTTWVSEHFWKLRCRKSPRLRSKCTKHRRCGALLAVEPSRSKSRCHFGAKHMSKSKSRMHLTFGRSTFWGPDAVWPGRRIWILHLLKSEPDVWVWFGFAAVSKTMAGVGRLKRMCQDACTVTGAALRMTWLHFFVAGAIL